MRKIFGFTLAEGATHVAHWKKSRKTAFTEPSRGMSGAKVEQTSAETLSFRCVCERCRLMRGEVRKTTRKVAFTLAEGATHVALSNNSRKMAFTLAEVLITLGIIGVIAALTLPPVIKNYQKKVTVERLKKSYSTLAQAVQMSVKDNDEIETWDFSLSTQDFMDKYIVPYIKDIQSKKAKDTQNSKQYILSDGTTIVGWSWVNPLVKPFVQLIVDINGDAGPNIYGRDIFIFHIFSQKANRYNGGTGDVAINIPKGGLYPDGYGYDRDTLLNYDWRGCNRKSEKVLYQGAERSNAGGAFCTALIILDGWQISKDYKW